MKPDEPLARSLSLPQLVELYRDCTDQLHQHAQEANGERQSLQARRQQIYEGICRSKHVDMSAPRHALLIGFVGRFNSGDEMMLEMHLQLLRSLGFSEVDVWTELPQHVTDYYHPLFWHPRKAYELVLVGGGGLDVGYGFYQACLAKFRFGAKIILSSVNLPSDEDRYLSLLRTLFDLVITRNASEYFRCKGRLPQLHFLQDVATVYQPQGIRDALDRTAVVVRCDRQTVLDFAPDGPFDVLVLSKDDWGISAAYADRFGATAIPLWYRDPRQHIDRLASYRRVLSVGRFHAALWGALHCEDYAYLFPTYFKPLPPEVRLVSGRLSWDEIQRIGKHHVMETKVGLSSDALHTYGIATAEQYLQLMASVLPARSTPPHEDLAHAVIPAAVFRREEDLDSHCHQTEPCDHE